MTQQRTTVEGGSQTLARGLTAITLIGDAEQPLTVPELAEQLGIHRSMAYRLVKTLEQHGFVERLATGELELGLRIAALARNVAKDLQAVAAPYLADIADALHMTAFLVTYDGESAVTLLNAEPRQAEATLAQRPGSRHPIDKGAPGRVIRSQIYPEQYPPKPFEESHDEVIQGITSIAVPLIIPHSRPSAIAVLFLPHVVDREKIVRTLTATAGQIAAEMR